MSLRSPCLLALAALGLGLGVGCAGFESRLAAYGATHGAGLGGRASVGMPKASGWLATALTVQGDSDGFFGATGGLELRAPRGITPRLTAAFGVGGHGFVGSGPHGEGGLGPYGESTLGLDVPIGGRMALTIAGGGMLRLDGDEFHGRAMALAGVVWK